MLYYILLLIPEPFTFFFLLDDCVIYDCDLHDFISHPLSKSKVNKSKNKNSNIVKERIKNKNKNKRKRKRKPRVRK